MYVGKISANLMSLGALDFGLIADGAIIVAENSLRRLAERQKALGRRLTADERLETIINSAVEMRRPTVYGQAIIILVYRADPHLLRRRGQDVPPDGDDRHHGACRRNSFCR